MTSRLGVPALVGLGVLVLGAGAFLVLGRSSASSAAPAPQIKPLHPVKKHNPVNAKVALAPPKLAAKASRAPKRRPAVVGGVPAQLADALKHDSVVVVALVSPKSAVDELTLGEAKAGAAAAHAGFVTVSVFDNAQVAALSALIGSSTAAQDRLLDAPAVLVFQQPKTLYVRLNGYADADTVQQAAVNAAPAPQR
jgi:hypothetical protein